ncbi:MAG: CDP-alcohol phosphatidyltransferase family protein [Candidatus Binatia bacterium]|nr:CDP-alcohol phosphatidyltransferase family protein [Candidatus Binatia bacterium]
MLNALNVPNALTMLRIAAIPAILIALDSGSFGLAFFLFFAAGVTDGLDGFIARYTDTRTELGAYLDPLADKGLVITLLVKLSLVGVVPFWVLTIILTRDIVCLTGYLTLFFVTGETIAIEPSRTGKWATFFQIGGLGVCLFLLWYPGFPVPWLGEVLLAVAAALTALAGGQYVWRGLTWYQARPA